MNRFLCVPISKNGGSVLRKRNGWFVYGPGGVVAGVVAAVVVACHLLVAHPLLGEALLLGGEQPVLGLHAALDPLAHRIGFLAHVEGALLRRFLVLAIDLPGALGHRGRRGPVGEDDAAVGGALLVDLSLSLLLGGRGGQGDDQAGKQGGERLEAKRVAHGVCDEAKSTRRRYCATFPNTLPDRTRSTAPPHSSP